MGQFCTSDQKKKCFSILITPVHLVQRLTTSKKPLSFFFLVDRGNYRESELRKCREWVAEECAPANEIYSITPTPDPRLREHWRRAGDLHEPDCQEDWCKSCLLELLVAIVAYSDCTGIHQSMAQHGLGKGSQCTRLTPEATSMLGTLWLP